MSNKLGIFLAGGAVGAVAALLCAPRTGQEARTMVAEKVNEAWGQAQSISSDAGVNAQQVYQSAAARGPGGRLLRAGQGPGSGRSGRCPRAGGGQQPEAVLHPGQRRAARQDRGGASAHRFPRWPRTPRKPARWPRKSSRPWPRLSSPLRKRSPRQLSRPRSRRPNSILFQS